MNSSILTLKTWLIILEIIQLVKYLIKKFKYIKQNKKNVGIIKQKKSTSKQKALFNLFNELLDLTLTDKTLKSESQK